MCGVQTEREKEIQRLSAENVGRTGIILENYTSTGNDFYTVCRFYSGPNGVPYTLSTSGTTCSICKKKIGYYEHCYHIGPSSTSGNVRDWLLKDTTKKFQGYYCDSCYNDNNNYICDIIRRWYMWGIRSRLSK